MHLEYMIAAKDDLIIGGPVRTDDMSTTLGSMFVIEKNSRNEVDEFLKNEPYYKNGLFESVIIRAIDIMVPERLPGFLSQELARERKLTTAE